MEKNLKKREKGVTIAIRSIGLSLTVWKGKHRIPVIHGIGNTRTIGVDCLMFECFPGEYEVKDKGPGRKVYTGRLIVGEDGKVDTRGWRLMNPPIVLQNPLTPLIFHNPLLDFKNKGEAKDGKNRRY